MKEDVLEQVVDDYLKFKGSFTTHNVRFRPRPDHARIDIARRLAHGRGVEGPAGDHQPGASPP